MLRVALTGGMGSGKTAAAVIFQDLGCFISHSDEVARAMMQPGQAVYSKIVRVFGAGVVRSDGTLNRGELARLAFGERRLEELNAIVHPAVIARQTAWMQEIGAAHPQAVAMVESALVFETRHGAAADRGTGGTPWRTWFDRIVLVTASENVRLERYLARVGASSSEERIAAQSDARARMQAQLPDVEKAAMSDSIIANNGTLEALRREVERVWQQLRQESEDRADEAM